MKLQTKRNLKLISDYHRIIFKSMFPAHKRLEIIEIRKLNNIKKLRNAQRVNNDAPGAVTLRTLRRCLNKQTV